MLRTYLTRHGEGPFPTEDAALAAVFPELHNDASGWQGTFRVGWPDPSLVRYALAVNGGVDSIALTHVDRLSSVDVWQAASPYRVEPGADLDAQAELTGRLTRMKVELRRLPLGLDREATYCAWLEAECGVRVSQVSTGPTAADHRER